MARRVAFWSLIGVSCLCLALAILLGAGAVLLFFKEGLVFTGHTPLDVATTIALVLQPVAVLTLIVRAINRRNTGGSSQIIARAFYPLFPILLLPLWIRAINYLEAQSDLRMMLRWYTGRITYVCATHSPSADYNVKTARPTELRLTEYRHPDRLGDWIVAWPGKVPVRAGSFRLRTGSIGGSQGIRWREPDGRKMVASISFSDVMDERGSQTVWVDIARDDAANPVPVMPSPDTYTCGQDSLTYNAAAEGPPQ